MFIAFLCIKCYYKINNLKGPENFADCTDESQEKLQGCWIKMWTWELMNMIEEW